MKKVFVALVTLLIAGGAASAQTGGSAWAVAALAEITAPVEEAGITTINAAPGITPAYSQVMLIAPRLVPPLLFRTPSRAVLPLPTPRWADLQPQPQATAANGHAGFQWASALKQSLVFLGVQHGYALTQAKTRRALKGPFWDDYLRAVAGTSGWADGGKFFTNYISHPMQGAISGYIQVQNDPRGINQEFSRARSYWTSRLKAMAWTAVYSTQFEIGPVSQSSIGNVGLYTSLDGKKRKMAYGDMVVTPTLGTAWLVGEDALDRYLIRWVEGRTDRLLWRGLARVVFNPMRGAANLIRFKVPWYRDR